MNTPTIAGIALVVVALFSPAPWAFALWFAGVALLGYGRGLASGERSMRRLLRGGDC